MTTTDSVVVMRSFWAILGASIIAGFGLAFGRDIYREVKANWAIIVVILLLMSLFIGVFFSCIWMARSYDELVWRIVGKTGGVVLFFICYFGQLFVFAFADIVANPMQTGVSAEQALMQSGLRMVDLGSWQNILFIFHNLIAIAGLTVGIYKRFE